MSKGRGARDALEADGVGGVGDAVEITPARAGRKLEVGHAAGTRPEKMPCSLDGRAGRSSAAAADDTQPSRRSKMTRSAWDQNLIAFCPLAGWLRRLVLLVDLIRNRLAALIDPCRVNHKKTQGSPFPPSIIRPPGSMEFSREVGGRKVEEEKKRREAAVGGGERGDVLCREEVEEERGHVRPEDLSR